MMNNNPPPIYVISKGRHGSLMTSRLLAKLGCRPHHLVVEPQEMADYTSALKYRGIEHVVKLCELDIRYKDIYTYCDAYGTTKPTGSGPARNFAWEHSIGLGASRHWIIDDNIRALTRLRGSKKTNVGRGGAARFFTEMEQYCDRFSNLAMAGPHGYIFVCAWQSHAIPMVFNTRCYSFILIRNDIPFRWRGRYNEDTILSLDVLKAGWCTLQFKSHLMKKASTQKCRGGNTDTVYAIDQGGIMGLVTSKGYRIGGTVEKSKMLARMHPDVTSVVIRYGRVHHVVDYSRFTQPLVLAAGSTPR